MSDEKPSKAQLWAGRSVSALPVLVMLGSAVGKLTHAAAVVEPFTTKFGFKADALTPIGITELLCVIVYAVPQTSVLGAILLTGYLGGATVTHARIGEPFIPPVVIGVLVWGGLFLRDPRLRALIPRRLPPVA